MEAVLPINALSQGRRILFVADRKIELTATAVAATTFRLLNMANVMLHAANDVMEGWEKSGKHNL